MIRISLFSIILCLFHTSVYSADITLQWDQSNSGQVEGYYLYFGNKSGDYLGYLDVGLESCYSDICEFDVMDLTDGHWYFAITAYDIYDRESDFSNEVYMYLPFSSICQGDFDQDGDVDSADLAIIQDEFGRTDCRSNNPCMADLNLDGAVTGHDIIIYINERGRTDCETP